MQILAGKNQKRQFFNQDCKTRFRTLIARHLMQYNAPVHIEFTRLEEAILNQQAEVGIAWVDLKMKSM